MQFHKSPSGPDCAGYHKFYVWASSRRLQWGSDNTNPIEKFRLFGEKRERCWFGGGCSFRTFGLELHWIGGIIAPPRSIPQYENPDSSPFDIAPRSWEKLNSRAFISDGFLCGKFHHLFIFWPLNALANAKSLSIFERNYKFPFYLMSCKRPGLEKFRPKMNPRIIWFRAGGLKEEIGHWQLWNMFEIFQFRLNEEGGGMFGMGIGEDKKIGWWEAEKGWGGGKGGLWGEGVQEGGAATKSERCLRAKMWRGCTQGLGAWERGKNRNATPKTAFGAPTHK